MCESVYAVRVVLGMRRLVLLCDYKTRDKECQVHFLVKLIIQWGKYGSLGNSYKAFTLPTSFSDVTYSACVTRYWDTPTDTNTFYINIGAKTINTFKLIASAGSNHGGLLISIGY